MVVLWMLGLLVLGFLYGAIRPGKQSTAELVGHGLAIGMVIAIAGVFMAALFGLPVLLAAMLGGLGILAASAVLSTVFAAGVFLGDVATGARGGPRRGEAAEAPGAVPDPMPLLDRAADAADA